jgi:predicted RNA-binding Zn-ribbon protein involved in translation (DUF1610 family)
MSDPACCQCGATKNPDDSAVLWRCASCGRNVCQRCTLTIPTRQPREYYADTLCSAACWEAAGRPDE